MSGTTERRRRGSARWVAVGALAVAILAAAQRPAAARDIDIESVLAPDIAAGERAYFREHFGRLQVPDEIDPARITPSSVSVAVIEGTSGVVHYSRAADVGTLVRGPSPALPGRGVPAGDGFDPGYNAKSGPYRRVYTAPVPGLPADVSSELVAKGVAAEVTLACNDGSHKAGDMGHVYLGGWSPTPNAPGGTVDAGLQYNNGQKKGSQDDYSPFINLGRKIGYWYKNAPPDDPNGQVAGHIPCGSPVKLLFLIVNTVRGNCPLTQPGCKRYDLGLAVYAVGATTPLQYVIWAPDYLTAAGPFEGGWGRLFYSAGDQAYAVDTACKGCIFKFMTSIAQKPPGAYADGSSFAATWSGRAISCGFERSCGGESAGTLVPLRTAFTRCSEYPLWGAYDNGPQDCRDTPKTAKGVARSVGVSGYSATGEADLIILTH